MANYQIQKVIYEGYLADEPVMRFLENGTAVINFRIGSTRTRKNGGGQQIDETIWLRVSVFGNYAETLKSLLGTGSHVVVEGRLRGNENGSPTVYQTKSGDWASAFEVIANDVRVLKAKPREDGMGMEDAGLPY